MNDFKVRFFRTKKKEMVYGFEGCSTTYVLGMWENEKHVTEPMFYTGLNDKNGTDIYAGDILKRTVTVQVFGSGTPPKDVEEFLKVEYNKEYAGFFIGETQLFAYVGARYDVHTQCKCTDVVVIGNIYENPELLERSR